MKTTRIVQLVLIVAMALSAVACGKIPSKYKGKYLDAATGTTLELTSSEGILTMPTKTLTAKISKVDVQALSAGTPGIYTRVDEADEDYMEIFWIDPYVNGRKEEAGLLWMNSEVVYTKINTKNKEAAKRLKVLHCDQGLVMIDTVTGSWNGGCPEDADEFDMVKQEK